MILYAFLHVVSVGFNVSIRTCAADVEDGLTPESVAIVPEGLFELLDDPEYLERSADISFAKSVFKLPVPVPEPEPVVEPDPVVEVDVVVVDPEPEPVVVPEPEPELEPVH